MRPGQKITPVGDHALVRHIKRPKMSGAGLIVKGESEEHLTHQFGEVIAVGDDERRDCAAGDIVYLGMSLFTDAHQGIAQESEAGGQRDMLKIIEGRRLLAVVQGAKADDYLGDIGRYRPIGDRYVIMRVWEERLSKLLETPTQEGTWETDRNWYGELFAVGPKFWRKDDPEVGVGDTFLLGKKPYITPARFGDADYAFVDGGSLNLRVQDGN